MTRLERLAERVRARPVLAVFVFLAAVPNGLAVFVFLAAVPNALAVFSFRQPIPLPEGVLSELEFLFRLFVYAPVAIVRSVLFEPLGLEMIFAVPGLEQATIVCILLGFYYLVSVVLVRVGRRLSDVLEAAVD